MPPKVIYLAMESDPTLEFDHFLAEKLGQTLATIEAMPVREYQRWVVYYGRRAQHDEIAAARARASRGR